MARDFDGAFNFLSRTTAPVTAYPFTLACWYNADTMTASRTLISFSDGSSLMELYIENVAGGTLNARAGLLGNCNATAAITTGTWQHACGVYASSTSRACFMNGGSKGTNTTSVAMFTANSLRIGLSAYFGSSVKMDGGIAVPCVWNVALTDDEVAQLAAGYHPTCVRPDAIVALWEFDTGASTEPDYWGGYSLTNSGSTQREDPPLIYPAGVIDSVFTASAPPPATGNRRRRLLICGAA